MKDLVSLGYMIKNIGNLNELGYFLLDELMILFFLDFVCFVLFFDFFVLSFFCSLLRSFFIGL